MTFRLVLVGPPGSGKGTQATILSERLGIPAISSGAIFRAEIATGSEVGQIAASFIDDGNLVPDDVTNVIVSHRLSQPDAQQGFLLDGYPRNPDQVSKLDEMLAEYGHRLDAVIELTIPDEEIMDRLLHRAEVEHRADDTRDVIQHRIEVYHSTTQPLIDLYEERGILVRVDGVGTIDEVLERLVSDVRGFLGR